MAMTRLSAALARVRPLLSQASQHPFAIFCGGVAVGLLLWVIL